MFKTSNAACETGSSLESWPSLRSMSPKISSRWTPASGSAAAGPGSLGPPFSAPARLLRRIARPLIFAANKR